MTRVLDVLSGKEGAWSWELMCVCVACLDVPLVQEVSVLIVLMHGGAKVCWRL
jgi:hypothetical protein